MLTLLLVFIFRRKSKVFMRWNNWKGVLFHFEGVLCMLFLEGKYYLKKKGQPQRINTEVWNTVLPFAFHYLMTNYCWIIWAIYLVVNFEIIWRKFWLDQTTVKWLTKSIYQNCLVLMNPTIFTTHNILTTVSTTCP